MSWTDTTPLKGHGRVVFLDQSREPDMLPEECPKCGHKNLHDPVAGCGRVGCKCKEGMSRIRRRFQEGKAKKDMT